MKTICVTAAYSKMGKTLLVQELLSLLPGWAACKVTACVRHDNNVCPRGQEDSCGICFSLEKPFEIEETEQVIMKEGTDTWRYRISGAEKVIWIKARPESLASAIDIVNEKLKRYPGVIFEGNHVLKHINPDLAVMIESKTGKYKASALEIRDRIDLFINPGAKAEEVLKHLR